MRTEAKHWAKVGQIQGFLTYRSEAEISLVFGELLEAQCEQL